MKRLILVPLIALTRLLLAVENDVAFLIDFSDEEDRAPFQAYVVSVAGMLNTTTTKVAIYIYSGEPQRLHALTDDQTVQSYVDAFDRRNSSTAETNTAAAIEGAVLQTFGTTDEDRHSTIILVTNGGSTDTEADIAAANQFKTDEVGFIYVVAVNVSMDEEATLKTIASDPDSIYYLSGESTDDLAGLTTALGGSLNAEPVVPTTAAPCPGSECENAGAALYRRHGVLSVVSVVSLLAFCTLL